MLWDLPPPLRTLCLVTVVVTQWLSHGDCHTVVITWVVTQWLRNSCCHKAVVTQLSGRYQIFISHEDLSFIAQPMYGAERLFCLVCCNLQVVGLPYTLFFKYSFFTVRFSKEKEGNAMAVIPVISACKNPETICGIDDM